MPRQGITYDEVAAAADRMTAAGERPNTRNILASLGRGSSNTIHQHLKKWREARPKERLEGAAALPPEIARPILAELQRRRTEAVAELEQQLAEARSEADALAAEGERQEIRIGELDGAILSLTSERDTLAGASGAATAV
jgi:colicin import membrane protein